MTYPAVNDMIRDLADPSRAAGLDSAAQSSGLSMINAVSRLESVLSQDEKAGDYSFRTTCINEPSSRSLCTVNPKARLRFNMVVFWRRTSP